METQEPEKVEKPRRGRRRAQLSCTECRRRKQKCNPRPGSACVNCSRRYPPVECVFLPDPKGRAKDEAATTTKELGVRILGPATNAEVSLPSTRTPPLTSLFHFDADDVPHDASQMMSHSKLELEVASTMSSTLGTGFENVAKNVNNLVLCNAPSFQVEDEGYHGSNDERQIQFYHHTPDPSSFAGTLTQVNGMHTTYVHNSMRNVELWNFFHQFVVPNMCSVDGSTTPPLYTRELLPWMIQSPLMPHIAILMSSATQTAEPGMQVIKSTETFAIKSQVLALINDFLKQDFNLISGEALRSVIHLVVIEWWWGSTPSLWAHFKGVKQMMEVRGGFDKLNDPVLQNVLMLTDIELACCFERDLFLLDPVVADQMPLPVAETYAENLRSPLLAYPETFKHDKDVLSISDEAAEILDDVRFLTLSIVAATDTTSTAKILTTASWLHDKVSNFPRLPISPASPPSTTITLTIRLITVLYTLSISTLTPTSHLWTLPLMNQFFAHITTITMSQWKEIPGIFLWIMLVAATGSGEDARGKWLRKKMAITGMHVGMCDFGLGISCLRNVWRVQRWVERERRKKMDGIDKEEVEEKCTSDGK